MFVTTADPELEPPIITINTVLSLVAVNYPANKLCLYVSDDGCSPLIYYSLIQTIPFAKLWIPFCKKYNLQVRAPFKHFSTSNSPCLSQPFSAHQADQFQQEWERMKMEYEQLCWKLEAAAEKGFPPDFDEDLAIFSGIQRQNHPTIVKVIWENKEGVVDGLPHLIYISREKRPNHPHNYKAGAMNVLTRVSGLMTNAPFMLNVDCDMFVNNPEIVRLAMCLLLGSTSEIDCAFVQSPQLFHDSPENELLVMQKAFMPGLEGSQGPVYQGSGCFHRRKVIYGLWPDDVQIGGENSLSSPINEKLGEDRLSNEFGESKEFVKSVVEALKGKTNCSNNLLNFLEEAHRLGDSTYEYGTGWGKNFGWIYGSITEDVNTGLKIHEKGWKSIYLCPEPPAFLGCAPKDVPRAMSQQKRWITGLLEILASKNNPILGVVNKKLHVRQCLTYLWLLSWGLRSIFELSYVFLPAFCLIINSNFLPKVDDIAMCIPVSILVIYILYTISEYLNLGMSIRCWLINQNMSRIIKTSAWLFGIYDVVLKLLGVSNTIFVVTKKDISSISSIEDSDATKFTFDESIYFVPGTTILLVHLMALSTQLLRLGGVIGDDGNGSGVGEVICSLWVVQTFWPFLNGFFEKGKYGIPSSTICKSIALTSFFFYLSKKCI